MRQPTIPDEWFPIAGSSQFIDASTSTALTVPAIAAGQPAKGAIIVGVLTAQFVGQWLRFDGAAVTAASTGGEFMYPGDIMEVYGYKALTAVRVIRNAVGGSLAVKYFYFRPSGV